MKGYIITYLPFKKYILLVIILLLFSLFIFYSPIWYPKLSNVSFKLNPSNSDITTISDIWNNPQDYDGKTVTIEGTFSYYSTSWYTDNYLNLVKGYNLVFTEQQGFSVKSVNSDHVTQDVLTPLNGVNCLNSQPIVKATGQIKVDYFQTSQYSRTVNQIEMPSPRIEFVKCG